MNDVVNSVSVPFDLVTITVTGADPKIRVTAQPNQEVIAAAGEQALQVQQDVGRFIGGVMNKLAGNAEAKLGEKLSGGMTPDYTMASNAGKPTVEMFAPAQDVPVDDAVSATVEHLNGVKDDIALAQLSAGGSHAEHKPDGKHPTLATKVFRGAAKDIAALLRESAEKFSGKSPAA